MSAHTPGPWVAGGPAWFRGRSDPAAGKRPITAGTWGVIANVYGESNASLISAAPELLAVLKAVVSADAGGCWRNLSGENAQAALAAIAKAEGREP